MEFRIADTFTASLARLTADEQKAVKTTAFDLQFNPASPGIQLHRLGAARDKNFWATRVGRDVRLIVHRTDASVLLCYVSHHDAAYRWAERRKLERHPTTGAAQIVEIRETVREIEIPAYVVAEPEAKPAPTPLFAETDEGDLLGYGVPPEWLDDVRAATEDTLFDIADHLPAEAAEALLELATGGTPRVPVVVAADADPFSHPDAQRRFRLTTNVEELERALEYPWEKWLVFLHPAQWSVVEREHGGPARVSGSAGTGKTVVALHRADHLARSDPPARVLLTTFSDTLASLLERKLDLLVGGELAVRGQITVRAIDRVALELYASALGQAVLASDADIASLIGAASKAAKEHRFADHFLETEWHEVVDAWQLSTWEDYRDVARLGRRTRIGEKQRELLWSIFERVRADLTNRELITLPGVFAWATEHLLASDVRPFDAAVVDEAQDIGVPQLRFLAALAGDRPNSLFFAGDLGQRIFQTPFSWRSLGVDVRGRSHTLRLNYRTSHQIRRQADLLLPPELSDVDGNSEQRRGTVSAFNGPFPTITTFASPAEESRFVGAWLRDRLSDGVPPDGMGIIVRSKLEMDRALAAAEEANLQATVLDGANDGESGSISICTMHLAKGLEFRNVAVLACDDEVIPSQPRIEAITDEADLEDVYNTERHLLYVACTRARDQLLVTGVQPASEFLDDLQALQTGSHPSSGLS